MVYTWGNGLELITKNIAKNAYKIWREALQKPMVRAFFGSR